MPEYEDLLNAALNLQPLDRLRLIDALWETIAIHEARPPSPGWIQEAQARSAEYDAGGMAASPWKLVRDLARQNAGLDE